MPRPLTEVQHLIAGVQVPVGVRTVVEVHTPCAVLDSLSRKTASDLDVTSEPFLRSGHASRPIRRDGLFVARVCSPRCVRRTGRSIVRLTLANRGSRLIRR